MALLVLQARSTKPPAPKFDDTNFPTLLGGAAPSKPPSKHASGSASPKRPPTPTRHDLTPPVGTTTPPTEEDSVTSQAGDAPVDADVVEAPAAAAVPEVAVDEEGAPAAAAGGASAAAHAETTTANEHQAEAAAVEEAPAQPSEAAAAPVAATTPASSVDDSAVEAAPASDPTAMTVTAPPPAEGSSSEGGSTPTAAATAVEAAASASAGGRNASASPFKPATPTRNAWGRGAAATFVETLRRTAQEGDTTVAAPALTASSGPSRAPPAVNGAASRGGKGVSGGRAEARPISWVQTGKQCILHRSSYQRNELQTQAECLIIVTHCCHATPYCRTCKGLCCTAGEAVSRQYAAARADASDHARLRNMYFQQATQAYLAGNKALAKELGSKGRAQSDLMKKAHLAAAERIYQSRNGGERGGNADRAGDRRGRRSGQVCRCAYGFWRFGQCI